MKAYFDAPQPPLKTVEQDGKIYLFIAVNGQTVERTYDEHAEPQTCWECDYREIVTRPELIDVEDVRANPEAYLDWREPTDAERITNLERELKELKALISAAGKEEVSA